MIPITRESIPEFFRKVAEALIKQIETPPNVNMPTDRFYHGFGGEVEGTPMKFGVAMMLTTDDQVMEEFFRDFVAYAKQKVAEKGQPSIQAKGKLST